MGFSMNTFRGLADVEVSGTGNYLSAGGTYLLEIRATEYITTRKSGDAFIVEFVVLESTHEKHRVGSRATWFQSLRDKAVAFPSIKRFMCALFGVDTDGSTEESKSFLSQLEPLLTTACDNKAMLRGFKIRCETVGVTTQKGLDFTRHDWETYEGEQPELG